RSKETRAIRAIASPYPERSSDMQPIFRRQRPVVALVAASLALGACASLNNKEKGGIIGATGGAVVGGAIGNANGSTANGAILLPSAAGPPGCYMLTRR